MSLLQALSPRRALRDLATFLKTRKRHQVWMVLPALAVVAFTVFAFVKDSKFFPEYKPNIIYVKSWPLDRSDDVIKAEQAIDQARIDKEKAELEKKQQARQEEFKKIDNTLKGWGL
jgi:hypothetical protein